MEQKMEHELKIWPIFFEKMLSGEKKFDVRKDDRDFRVGDTLKLREWKSFPAYGNPTDGEYTGRILYISVDYILRGYNWGIRDGFVVMSITPLNTQRNTP